MDWLAKNRRELIDAEFALNEGGSGRTDKPLEDGGRVVVQTIHVGEMTPVSTGSSKSIAVGTTTSNRTCFPRSYST